MALWLRLILTLVLGPILWRLLGLYLQANQGPGTDALLQGLGGGLAQAYMNGTFPALVLTVIVLMPATFVLQRLGLDLLIVGLAPLLAWLLPHSISIFVRDPHVRAWFDVPGLAFAYGLVWGLTVREPPQGRRSLQRSAAKTRPG